MKTIIDSKLNLETAKEIAIRVLQISFEEGVTFKKSDVELIAQLDLTEQDFIKLSQEANYRAFTKVTY